MKSKHFLIAAALILSVSAGAQVRRLSNNIYVSLGGEYAGLFDNQRIAKPSLGIGGDLGFGYELQYNRFLFDAGLSVSFDHITSKIGDTTIVYRAVDSEGDSFVYNHLYRNNKYAFNILNLNIPLLFGSRLGSNFYFLAGARVSLNFYGKALSNTLLTTSGYYDRYIGEFVSLPNHYIFNDKPVENSRQFALAVDVAVGGEIGYIFGSYTRETGFDVPRNNTQFRLSAYAYYGLLDSHPRSGGVKSFGPMFDYTGGGSEAINYVMNSVYLSTPAADAYINRLTVGLKLTVLFKMPEPKRCVMCEETIMPRRSGGSGRFEYDRMVDAQK